MTKPIEYFFSTHSAFAYLGSALFRQITERANRPVRYVPFDLRRGLAASGHDPTGGLTSARRSYFFGREIERWSEYRDAPVISNRPTWHDHDLARSSSMVIAADQADNNVSDLVHAMLSAHWRNDADLDDADTLVAIADSVGLDGKALLRASDDADIQAQYQRNTDEAISRNVFGSPTYIVDDDMFYGQDRLELVERALSQPFR